MKASDNQNADLSKNRIMAIVAVANSSLLDSRPSVGGNRKDSVTVLENHAVGSS